MALESRGRLTATMIDLTQHPEMAGRFGVTTVPYFVAGERVGFAGPLPELILLQRLLDQTAGSGPAEDVPEAGL